MNAALTNGVSMTRTLEHHLANRQRSGELDLHAETAKLLESVGFSLGDCGGKLTFYGQDPIVPSCLRFGAVSAASLAAKAVAIAAIWRMRTGEGQDIHVDVRKAIRRFAPFFEGEWEKLNGYAGGYPWMVTNPFQTAPLLFQTGDGRWVMPLNMYPRIRSRALTLLEAVDNIDSVRQAISKWRAAELEIAGAEAGVVMPMLRTVEEFMRETQYTDVLAHAPLIHVEKVAESDPVPFSEGAQTPLEGLRALGMGHVIAGSGFGRALALHGADVLNVWQPLDVEHERLYNSANVGLRSTVLPLKTEDGRKVFDSLLQTADVFFANRRPQYLERYGLSAEELCARYPGLVHAQILLHGDTGPWANRVGFDESAGAASGLFALEGTPEEPKLPPVKVVNDYITGWLANLGALAALRRRAVEGGSYRVTVALTRTNLWLLSLGIFDKAYAHEVAGSSDEHTYVAPDLFTADTPLGRYQGVTEQVAMSKTPGFYRTVLVPRGSSEPVWLPRRLA